MNHKLIWEAVVLIGNFILRFIMLLSSVCIGTGANAVQEDATKLTVWIRAGGNAVKSEISSFVRQVLEKIPQNITSQILVCTNEGDTILEELDTLTKVENRVKVIFSHLSSFSTSLSVLAKNTDPESNVLSLSVGVNIRQDQIETGLSHLRGRVRVYGWTVSDHGNDGSVPGKGWYNTATLIDKIIVRQMVEEGVPNWVDNGVLGMIGQHTIGGNEEIPIMVKALQREPKAKFILNVGDPVSSSLRLGTGISFQEKLERKVVVGQHYMQKLHRECGTSDEFESWQKFIWKSIRVI